MSTIIALDGGIGRIITAIPALLKYHKKHPDDEWYITISGWDFLTWGIPELQERTFNSEAKGIFTDYYWKASKVISPEPYRVPEYYRNEISLREAFDIALNDSYDHSDLPELQLNLSSVEKRSALELIDYVKTNQRKEKTIVVQPHGSSASLHPLVGVIDDSLRSIPEKMLEYFIRNLSKDYNVIYMGAADLHDGITYRPDPDPSIREWAAVIRAADYFVGCDSCGQHIAKAVGQDASVVLAGTHKINTSYPDSFHIIERDVPFYSDAMRVSSMHSYLSSALNEPRIDFTDQEIKNAYTNLVNNIEKKSPKDKKINNLSYK